MGEGAEQAEVSSQGGESTDGAPAQAEQDEQPEEPHSGEGEGATQVQEHFELFPLETVYHWWDRFERNRQWHQQQKDRLAERKREQLLKQQAKGLKLNMNVVQPEPEGPSVSLRHHDMARPIMWGGRIGGSRAPLVFLQGPSQALANYLRYDPLGPFTGGILEWMYSSHWDWERWGFREDGKEKVLKADWFAIPSSQAETEVFVPRMAKMDKMKRAPPRVEAFAEAFRAVNRETWSIIHDTLAGWRASRGGGRVLDEVAGSFLEHSHFGTIEAQIRWGDTSLLLPSHKDGATSLLHLGVTLGGRRVIRAGVFPSWDSWARSEENVWDEALWEEEHLKEVSMVPGSVYLSSPFCFEHGVRYEETIQHDPVIALQFRFAFRGTTGPDVNAVRNDVEMLDITRVIAGVLKVAADGGYIRLPSLDEVKSAENRLAMASRRARKKEQEAQDGMLQ